jgi:hypothetical protein
MLNSSRLLNLVNHSTALGHTLAVLQYLATSLWWMRRVSGVARISNGCLKHLFLYVILQGFYKIVKRDMGHKGGFVDRKCGSPVL